MDVQFLFRMNLALYYITFFNKLNQISQSNYRAFHGLGQAEFACGGLVLGLNQFTLLPQLAPKMMLNLNVVKIDTKIIILICKSKSVTHSV